MLHVRHAGVSCTLLLDVFESHHSLSLNFQRANCFKHCRCSNLFSNKFPRLHSSCNRATLKVLLLPPPQNKENFIPQNCQEPQCSNSGPSNQNQQIYIIQAYVCYLHFCKYFKSAFAERISILRRESKHVYGKIFL